jgi:hypothetical protein
VPNKNEDTSGAGRPAARAVLSSWKEIAEFFQIDVRTCQRWEKAFGLPVHRLGQSPRSRVLAYADELNEWRANSFKAKAEAGHVAVEAPPRRWRRINLAGAALLCAAIAVIAVVALDRVPDGFRIRGSRLIVTNRYGLRLWSVFAGLADTASQAVYRAYFQEKAYRPYQGGEQACFPWLIFRDLNGDGRKEVLWIPRSESGRHDENQALALLDSRGRELWRFAPGREIVIDGLSYPPSFVINILETGDFDGDGRDEILLAAHCYGESPTRIVLLDLQKNIRGEYWNFGQLADVALGDIDGDGRSEFVFASQNNEVGGPALVALDPVLMRGGSPSKKAGWAEGTEKLYAVFPTLEIDLLRSERAAFQSLRLLPNRHFQAQTTSILRLDIAPGLAPLQVVPTDVFLSYGREAFRTKRVSSPFDREQVIRAYAEESRYFDGSAWISTRSIELK